MRRVQIDTIVRYVDEVDQIIDELNELRTTMARRMKPKDKKKQSKREKLRTKEALTWDDIFKILRRHYETDSITARRTSNLLSMMTRMSYGHGINFVVRCNNCSDYVSTPGEIAEHGFGCEGRGSSGSTRILNVVSKSVLKNHEKVADITEDYSTASGRRRDLALLVGFLEGKVK